MCLGMTAGCISAGWRTAGSKGEGKTGMGRERTDGQRACTGGGYSSEDYCPESHAQSSPGSQARRPLEHCSRCRRALTADETAMTKKLINRGTSVYYCMDCLAEMFDVERKDIEEKIAYYKRMGCTLFQ